MFRFPWRRGAISRPRPGVRLALTPLDDRCVPAGFDPTPAASYQLLNDWGSGYQGEIALTNDQGTKIEDWRLSFDFGRAIGNIWNAKVVKVLGTRYEIGPADYNRVLPNGGKVAIGFTGSGGSTADRPAGYELRWAGGDPATPPPAGTGASAAVAFKVDNDWGTGFTGTISITNTGTSPINGWRLAFHSQFRITNIWNGTVIANSAGQYTVRDAGYNALVGPGQTVSFGFQGDPGRPAPPTGYTLNGIPLGGTTSPPPVSPPPAPPPAPLPTVSVGNVTVTEPAPTPVTASGYLRTSGNQIVDSTGQPVRIAGVNWFGMESNTYAPHGLWTRGYKSMMDQMKRQGFNTIRLPFSQEAFEPGRVPNGIDFGKNPDLQGLNALQILDKIVAYAGQIGLRIMLDHHRSNAGPGPNENGLWYTAAYPESKWISTWTMLAARYANNPTVIGADLANEPHNGTWGTGGANDWRLAAERAGNAILAVNPNWLIVVEGVANGPSGSYWWGGNLSAAGTHPVRLNVPGRLVYSPHDYPSTVYNQPWFSDPNYPNNLPAIWDANWGYLYKQNIAPVILGEFGTKYETASDKTWLAALTNYLGATKPAGQPQGISWTYWSWNPNSGDTGGILADDWNTVRADKVNAVSSIRFGLLPTVGVTPAPAVVYATFTVKLSAASTTPVSLKYATTNGTAKAGLDYVAVSGTITFAPGQTTQTVSVAILADTVKEPDETFFLDLSAPTGATLAVTRATGTIRDAS